MLYISNLRQSLTVDDVPPHPTIILPNQAYSVQRIVTPEPLFSPARSFEAPLPKIRLRKRYLQGSLVALLCLFAGVWGWLQLSRPLQLSPNQGGAELTLPADFAAVPNVPEGVYNYGGSTAWALVRPKIDAAIAAAYPNLQLRYIEAANGTPGSGQGIKMLLEGKIDFAQSTRPLKDAEYKTAQNRGFKLTQYAVGIDGVAIVVHPSLNLPGITIPQLRQIYLGNVRNWQELGGPDQAITPLSRQPGNSGTADYFQEYVLQNQSFGSTVTLVYSTTDALRQFNRDRGAIYYASAAEVLYQCLAKPIPLGLNPKRLIPPQLGARVSSSDCPSTRNRPNLAAFRDGSYPMTRPLYVIVKENQDREQLIGDAYRDMMLSEQGQQVLEQAGFVRIK
ncbi:MAG: phosphate ABC transporter substrate-binding protein [Acaryochloris sp. RU_4_1]|nr:phosphate ABC transporter substrate-binding protein [Acaryochloris sp. RU_4_1]NJR55877.1 phosphate ABC transporter substrate-binding protein [Acaryochloris sp. CRU_2_0]